MRSAVVALVACLVSANVWAKEQGVYLIASEPYLNRLEGFPTLLYRVEDGELIKVRTVTTQQQGANFVDVIPGRGYVLVGSDRGLAHGSLLLDVIDMGSVSAQTSYEMEICQDCSIISSHMQEGADGQHYFVVGYNAGSSSYKGVNLKSGHLTSSLGPIDEANAYRTGTGSSFVDRLSESGGVLHDGDLFIFGEGEGPHRLELGLRLPGGKSRDPGSIAATLLVNNDDIRLTMVFRNGEWTGEVRGLGLYVFDKDAEEWSRLKAPRGVGSFRAFGHWLMREDIQWYEPGALDLDRLKLHHFPPFLSAAERFESRHLAPSGRLFFYNARTKATIVHDTGEPDAEALYVDEEDVAWYRVSDELRRAPIQEGKLGPEEVVAKAPELWAVHWLFFGTE